MSNGMTTSPVIVIKILLNSSKSLVLTLFMLLLAYFAATLGYTGAAIFFAIVTIAFGAALYRKVTNERIRAQFGEYRINM